MTTKDGMDLVGEVCTLISDLARDGDLPRGLATTRLSASTRICDLGLDSLGKVNLITAIDHNLGIYLVAERIPADETLGALAERIALKRRGG